MCGGRLDQIISRNLFSSYCTFITTLPTLVLLDGDFLAFDILRITEVTEARYGSSPHT